MPTKLKKRRVKKTIPTSIALDDESNPNRTKDFAAALDKGGVAPRAAIRELIDAYTRFVAEHGRVPTFPMSIISADAVKPARSKK